MREPSCCLGGSLWSSPPGTSPEEAGGWCLLLAPSHFLLAWGVTPQSEKEALLLQPPHPTPSLWSRVSFCVLSLLEFAPGIEAKIHHAKTQRRQMNTFIRHVPLLTISCNLKLEPPRLFRRQSQECNPVFSLGPSVSSIPGTMSLVLVSRLMAGESQGEWEFQGEKHQGKFSNSTLLPRLDACSSVCI